MIVKSVWRCHVRHCGKRFLLTCSIVFHGRNQSRCRVTRCDSVTTSPVHKRILRVSEGVSRIAIVQTTSAESMTVAIV
jgi:hypothetical protein